MENPNGNSWNRSGTNACVHAFVGKLAISVDKLATKHEDMDGDVKTTNVKPGKRCESTVDMALCAVLSAVIAKV